MVRTSGCFLSQSFIIIQSGRALNRPRQSPKTDPAGRLRIMPLILSLFFDQRRGAGWPCTI
jgi:hypothetical protein